MAVIEGLERIVGEHPFFANLDADFLDLVTGCAKNVRYDPGQHLFREGGDADQFFLVRDGHVALEFATGRGSSVTFLTVGPGDAVGYSWIFPPYKWDYDTRAVEATRVVALDAVCLRTKCDANTALGYEVMKRAVPFIVERMKAARLQAMDVYGAAS